MSEIIFHHYPQSPVAEKVRAAFGIKKLAWRSVEHNRLPDRPELFAMTAGYRRIPVMQAGADIYCDSQCILRELERRFPSPTFFPGPGKGMPWAVSRWTDGPLFDLLFRVAFAPVMDSLPPALVTVGTYWAYFQLLEIATAAVAIVIDRKPGAWRLLPLLLVQRFCYRQLLYVIAIRVAIAALKGRMMGWNKLMRTGSVTIAPMTPSIAKSSSAS